LNGQPGWFRNFSETYRNYGVSLGRPVARWLRTTRPDSHDGAGYIVELSVCPGASVPTAQFVLVSGSVTTTPVSVTLPVLVTVKV